MESSNSSVCSVSEFYLICFPELNSGRYVLSICFVVLMLSSLVANSLLMTTVFAVQVLQEPIYYLLSMLAAVDMLLCVVSTPKTLALLWFDAIAVDTHTCFAQMYFIYSCVSMESALFLILAFDRYISICHPLRYPSIITTGIVIKAAAFMLGRSLILSLPLPLLAAFRNYCSRNSIAHCYCETWAVVTLSAADSTIVSLYMLAVTSVVYGTDLLFIIFSYYMIIQAVLRLDSSGAALKALSTCSSHLILILFFYSTIFTILVSNQSSHSVPRHVHVLLSILYHLVPPALNPIVYAIRTKEIRQALRKLLGKIKVFPIVQR
ncbi:olfactory receptor 56A4-like [Pleurodeles waltl]|uniref:olfactory receptor 56A4-like n=1 Tax=Pleurodeles waltl TaxID=8319 RepID=UPI003709AE43